ncbi:hypothetical protein BN938_1406 [Mucinivorans hirudinis]|uniref:Uncharacterized protein n=1 Tax=Mucinivorans hirudinis TaxID=1433126 RepID=A0A060RCG8_9BACT|nr:hypothetical protein BN938_1406 [Mucinivorans hirudinis]
MRCFNNHQQREGVTLDKTIEKLVMSQRLRGAPDEYKNGTVITHDEVVRQFYEKWAD